MNDDAMLDLAIMRLQRAYADLATRRAFSEVAELATPDAIFSYDLRSGQIFEVKGVVAFGEFGARMTERFSFYEYIPLNFVVAAEADGRARGRAYSLEVAEDRETGAWIEVYGAYDDEYAQIEGTWRFAQRRYRTYGRRWGGDLQAFPL